MSGRERMELRSEMKRVLSNLDSRWSHAASAQVCENLNRIIEHDVGHVVSHILAWSPFFPGEVDLTPFIREQLGKREVYLPRLLADYSMTFAAIPSDWLDHLQAGHTGIPEPKNSLEKVYDASLSPLTAVIMPGLAFDQSGNRLGRGKGSYDRFLGNAQMDGAVKIGVAWQFQFIKSIPAEPHDVKVDWVCHEHYGVKCL